MESAVFSLVWARDTVLGMKIAHHGHAEMTESAPVLKTAPRPRVTGTAAPRSVPVKRGRGTAIRFFVVRGKKIAIRMANVREASCVVWITVRGYIKETAAAPLLLGAVRGVPVTRARLAAVKMRTAEDH